METLWELSWRAYPAAAIALLGVTLVVRGTLRERHAHRLGWMDMAKPLGLASGLRLLLLGGSLVAVAAGWYWQVAWIFALGVIIGAEETLETSIIVSALKGAQRPPGAQR
jgi:hypothetical protein